MRNKMKIVLAMIIAIFVAAPMQAKKKTVEKTDRQVWADLCYKISQPVLENMSKGNFQKDFPLELSPTWDGRDTKVAYLETFARLMAGISPWLALPDDGTPEGKQRKQLHEWAIQAYKNAVDPNSPDKITWLTNTSQPLCDASYLVESFMRAPEATWGQLDEVTKKRYIEGLKSLRTIRPAYNNWLLFRAMVEVFFMSIGEDVDEYALSVGLQKMSEWYLSDGWYSDGPEYAMDYYNSYVMHPMMVEVVEMCKKHKFSTPISLDLAVKRMNRFNTILERFISPEGAYPAVGRSVIYRMGAFQTLAMSAWKYGLPKDLTNGSVRSALTCVMKRMFAVDGNFDDKGYLRLGFAGHQPNLANYYSNNGSLYMTSLVFMPLGLPADHPFWTAPAEPWTSQKAWSGQEFPEDYHTSLRK
ncbi:DUF2264 domain-containing protein [Prevotella sp.]|uniref:DUF2264 domain-containing protein n=2 Tax=Prevotellaceae TaxID=171552 RepID=UPI0025EB2209|nr:DUF2264 domain-containing protein [Prevotella sp.]MEE0669165.1 DUF2264 domain-containing protein [Prevotella sp.]